MTEKVERQGNGQFKPGQSGNAQGARLRQRKKLLTLEDIDEMFLTFGASKIEIELGGQRTKLMHAELWMLKVAQGRPSERLNARDSLQMLENAARRSDARARDRDEQRRKEEARRARP